MDDQNEAPAEKSNRKKLSELSVSPDAMRQIQTLIVERIQNLGLAMNSGASPTQCLMSEICVLEAKFDALMAILETRMNVDFTDFNEYLTKAAAQGAASAVNIRHSMRKK